MDLSEYLRNAEDVTRIVQRFSLGRGDTTDLLGVGATVQVWSSIRNRVAQEREMEGIERGHVDSDEWASLDALMDRMPDFRELSSRINQALQGTSGDNQSLPLDSEEGAPEDAQEADPNAPRVPWKYDSTKSLINPE